MSQLIESLESRTLFSVVLTPKVLTPTQLADQQAIAAAQQALATARATRLSTLAADRANIRTVRNADNATISTDLEKEREDRGDPSQEEADILQTRADRSALVADVHAANVQLIEDNKTTYQDILTDIRTLSAARLKYLYDLAHHVE